MAGNNRERKLHLWGWLLFTVCAGFFIASAVVNGDTWGIAGSIVFFIACIVFIIPLVRR